MPYIKPDERDLINQFIENLAQVVGDDDGKLNYAISRLVASSYAPDGKWNYSLIQRAAGLFHCVAHEFDRRVADVYENEAIHRNGDILEYSKADEQDFYHSVARQIVNRFSASGTFKRVEFDQMISNHPIWDRQDDLTNRLHADGYIVMHPDTVTLGLAGLRLRKCQARILTDHPS